MRTGVALALLAAMPAAGTGADDRIPAVIAEFDNHDTSGEVADRGEEHAARVRGFADLVRGTLAADEKYEALRLECPESPCSAGSMDPEALIDAARTSGARLLVYGGIHKVSTLIQWGQVQVVDLEENRLLLDRSFSFRGDTDDAFRRAARFIAGYLDDIPPQSGSPAGRDH